MNEDNPARIDYKSQVTSQVSTDSKQFGNVNHTLGEIVTNRIESYNILSAENAAIQLERVGSQIFQNQEKLELGMRYHDNVGFQKVYNLYAKGRSLFGGDVKLPSLPRLLDLQEKTLHTYGTCLHQIAGYVRTQHAAITREVDDLEKQLGHFSASDVETQIASLRGSLKRASTQKERRTISAQLYRNDRLHKNIVSSIDFFDQYVAQEAILCDVAHSLEVLSDHTKLFETYISKSKGFFVSINGIGHIVSHLSPIVQKMKSQAALLQEDSNIVMDYLQQKSDEPLFSQDVGSAQLTRIGMR